MERCVVLIPALNPTRQLKALVEELSGAGFFRILVVDDGSDSARWFREVDSLSSVEVIRHPENLGKGGALKSGFRHILDHHAGAVDTVVTADADGQHLAGDIVRVAEAAAGHANRLVMGTRDFDDSTPLRSAFGNRLTRKVLGWVGNVKVEDTQTGLRGIPLQLARESCELRANRYEFELESLLLASELGYEIEQVAISTVYIENNTGSHFRPLWDSMRIYAVFVRFIAVSFGSFVVDIGLFALAVGAGAGIVPATFLARGVSSSLNFLGNKYLVFQSRRTRNLGKEAAGYFLLVVFTALASALLVSLAHRYLLDSAVLCKVIVDTALFLSSFLVQRNALFTGGRGRAQQEASPGASSQVQACASHRPLSPPGTGSRKRSSGR